MRNPFARTAKRDTVRPSLRERLKTTKAKAKMVLAVNATLMKPVPVPAPQADRVALINYASWLAFERVRVCAELYPHLGTKAGGFVLGLNTAERFFNPKGVAAGRRVPDNDVPPASSRAVKVLDLVGVDWRQDLDTDTLAWSDGYGRADTGKRPSLPCGWPALDAALTTAVPASP